MHIFEVHSNYSVCKKSGRLGLEQVLEGFQYATSLDLDMGYYRIRLSEEARNLCTIILSWGKYKYKLLPMGVCDSPDIF